VRFSRLSNEGVSLTDQIVTEGELAGIFNRDSPDDSRTGVNSSAFPAFLEAKRRYVAKSSIAKYMVKR
jgi:hypothetical protein